MNVFLLFQYAVVKFVEEDNCEVVPCNWLVKKNNLLPEVNVLGAVLWPPPNVKKSIGKAVINSETPSSTWSMHTISVLRYYGNFLTFHGLLLSLPMNKTLLNSKVLHAYFTFR